MPCTVVATDVTATFALRSLNKKQTLRRAVFRYGMTLVAPASTAHRQSRGPPSLAELYTVHEFEAEVVVLHHQTTIKAGYNARVHCGCIRQNAQILSIRARPRPQREGLRPQRGGAGEKEEDVLRTGSRAQVRFRFLRFAELLVPGSTLLFCEGTAKGVGKVTKVFPELKKGGC